MAERILRVAMSNQGGELESRTAVDEIDAQQVLLAMIEECGELHGGDVFTVSEVDA